MTETEAIYWALGFFAERGLLAYLWRDADAWRMRTLATEEPSAAGRHRHTIFFVRIAEFVDRPDCSEVQVRWLLESKDFYGTENWVRDENPSEFKPLRLDALTQVFRDTPCVR